jgi:hypothetical protein
MNAQFDSELGFNKHRIKYSAFVFRRNGAKIPGYRVITPPQKTPRGVQTTLCGPDLFGPVRIGKGERSSDNRPLEKANVFERVTVAAGSIQKPATSTLKKSAI